MGFNEVSAVGAWQTLEGDQRDPPVWADDPVILVSNVWQGGIDNQLSQRHESLTDCLVVLRALPGLDLPDGFEHCCDRLINWLRQTEIHHHRLGRFTCRCDEDHIAPVSQQSILLVDADCEITETYVIEKHRSLWQRTRNLAGRGECSAAAREFLFQCCQIALEGCSSLLHFSWFRRMGWTKDQSRQFSAARRKLCRQHLQLRIASTSRQKFVNCQSL